MSFSWVPCNPQSDAQYGLQYIGTRAVAVFSKQEIYDLVLQDNTNTIAKAFGLDAAIITQEGGKAGKTNFCECGGLKTGYPKGNPGHSPWCPWRNP